MAKTRTLTRRRRPDPAAIMADTFAPNAQTTIP